MEFTGRKMIYTNYLPPSMSSRALTGTFIELTDSNMHEAINSVMKVHQENSIAIQKLHEYYKGNQDILNRVKEVRSDIDNKVVLNYAQSITRNIVGYTFGKPIQYTQRRGKENVRDCVKLINDYMDAADKSASDQERAIEASICGWAYRGVFTDNTLIESDDVPFALVNFPTESTFVAYSTQIGNVPVFGGTYHSGTDEKGNIYTVYEVYTKDKYYAYKTNQSFGFLDAKDLIKVEPIYLGAVPIIQVLNNSFCMGHWEMTIGLMNAINVLASDSLNDVVQYVQSILVALGVEVTTDDMDKIKKEKFVSLSPSQPGMQIDMKYIAQQLNSQGVESLRQYLEDSLRAIVGIPDRKTRGGGGGDTGDAVKLRDGWADMEVVARTTEMYAKRSEKNELKIVLNILKVLNEIDDSISVVDFDIKFSRNKTDNLLSKVQAASTLTASHILNPTDALEIVDIVNDPSEYAERGMLYWDEQVTKETDRQAKITGGQNNQTQLEGGNKELQGGKKNAKRNTRN